MTQSINFTDENVMEEKGQVSCQGYKAKLVIVAGSRVKTPCSQEQNVEDS